MENQDVLTIQRNQSIPQTEDEKLEDSFVDLKEEYIQNVLGDEANKENKAD